MSRSRMRARSLVLVALMVSSVFAPMLALSTGAVAASGSPPAGLVGVPSENVDDIRPASAVTDVSADDLDDAVYVSEHASSTEVDIVTGEQADRVAAGAAPADIAGERVCSNPAAERNPVIECSSGSEFALVISDSVHHEGRRVAIEVATVEDALGYVPGRIAIANNETGEKWTSPATVRDGWLVADVAHFSSNSVSFTGTIDISMTGAQNGTSQSYDIADLDAATDPSATPTGVTSSEWDNVSASGVGLDHTASVSVGGNGQPTDGSGGTPVLSVTDASSGPTSSFDGGKQRNGYLWGEDNGYVDSEHLIRDAPLYIDSVTVNIDYNDGYDGTVDVYVVEETPDDTYGEGTLVKDNWSPSASTGNVSIAFNSAVATAGGDVTVEFVTNEDGSAGTAYVNGDSTKTLSTTAYTSEFHAQTSPYTTLDAPSAVWLEGSPASSVSVTTDDGASASFGDFTTGETKTRTLDVSTATTQLDITGSGAVSYTLTMQEHTSTPSGAIELNGNSTSFAALGEGETTNLSWDSSTLTEGTNYVNVSLDESGLSADAPPAKVDLVYSHDSVANQSTTFIDEALTHRYNVSKEFNSSQTDVELNISFTEQVYEMRGIEMRTNGGSWSAPQSYRITDTNKLVVDIGDVASGDVVSVRANGSLVETTNMSITVVEPTTSGDLDSKIRIDSVGTNPRMVVSPSGGDAVVHYPTKQSWADDGHYLVVDENGQQTLHLPNPSGGDTFRLKRHEFAAVPQSNEVRIRMEDDGIEPAFRVMPGATTGDAVDFIYYATTSGEAYVLNSLTSEVVRAQATAQSPVTLTDDDSLETLEIYEEDGSTTNTDSMSSSGDPISGVVGGAKEAASGIPPVLIVLAALGITVGLYYLDRRTPGERYILLAIGAIPTWLVALELVGVPVISLPLVAITGGGSGGVVPAIALSVTGVGLYLVYSWWQARKTDASTPEKVTNVSFNLRDGGGK